MKHYSRRYERIRNSLVASPWIPVYVALVSTAALVVSVVK